MLRILLISSLMQFYNYIVGINAPTRLQVDNLAFMHRHSYLDATLTTAVKAVSFASYGHHRRSGEINDASYTGTSKHH